MDRSRTRLTALALSVAVALAAPLEGRGQNQTAARGFAVRSADGQNELRLGGVFQYRYLRSTLDGAPSAAADPDRVEAGFQYRRLQFDLQGHVTSPRWTFRIRMDAANGGALAPAFAWVGYALAPGRAHLQIGQGKPWFLHEEHIPGPEQLAVERSYAADYFTADFAQLVQLTVRVGERAKLVGTLHTGSYSFRTDFDGDLTDLAVAARAEFQLAHGDPAAGWSQVGDFQSWSGSPGMILVGLAADYERGERGGPGAYPDVLKATADVTVKTAGAALFASVVGQRLTVAAPAAPGLPPSLDGAVQVGLVAQGSWFPVPDAWAVFGRAETLRFDGVYFRANQGSVQSGTRALARSRLSLVTLGATRHLRRHHAKVTIDAMRAFDPVPVANPGGGLRRWDDGGQWVVRTQLQVRF